MEYTMENVVLSFAGWRAEGSEAHRAIAALAPGDPLSLLHEDGQWKVFDDKGRQVGRMARKWAIPNGMRIVKAAVHGIFTRWAKDESDEEHKQQLRSESWEVVVPQVLLAREQSPPGDEPGTYSFSEKARSSAGWGRRPHTTLVGAPARPPGVPPALDDESSECVCWSTTAVS